MRDFVYSSERMRDDAVFCSGLFIYLNICAAHFARSAIDNAVWRASKKLLYYKDTIYIVYNRREWATTEYKRSANKPHQVQ